MKLKLIKMELMTVIQKIKIKLEINKDLNNQEQELVPMQQELVPMQQELMQQQQELELMQLKKNRMRKRNHLLPHGL